MSWRAEHHGRSSRCMTHRCDSRQGCLLFRAHGRPITRDRRSHGNNGTKTQNTLFLSREPTEATAGSARSPPLVSPRKPTGRGVASSFRNPGSASRRPGRGGLRWGLKVNHTPQEFYTPAPKQRTHSFSRRQRLKTANVTMHQGQGMMKLVQRVQARPHTQKRVTMRGRDSEQRR